MSADRKVEAATILVVFPCIVDLFAELSPEDAGKCAAALNVLYVPVLAEQSGEEKS